MEAFQLDIFGQQNIDQTKVGRDILITWANSAPPGWNRVIKRLVPEDSLDEFQPALYVPPGLILNDNSKFEYVTQNCQCGVTHSSTVLTSEN